MTSQVLCCKRGKVWVPDGFLTTVFDNCSKGQFVVSRTFSFPCVLLSNGNVFIEEQQGVELPIDLSNVEQPTPSKPQAQNASSVKLSEIRCGTCGGEVEIRNIDMKAILDKLRATEITMKHKARDSRKMDNK